MLWILSCHLITMVAWFAGLFYLPRLFVYHAECTDTPGNARFNVMEKKLFFYIMTPAAVLTTLFGGWLLLLKIDVYQHQWWMHIKLMLVALLWLYHLYCGHILLLFRHDKNTRSSRFYRYFNEIPTVLLIAIVILAVVKPSLGL